MSFKSIKISSFFMKIKNKLFGNPHLGSSLDDFLKEEGIYDECLKEAKKNRNK